MFIFNKIFVLIIFFIFKIASSAEYLTDKQIIRHYKSICEKSIHITDTYSFCNCMAEQYAKQTLTEFDFKLIDNLYHGTNLESELMDPLFNFDYDSALSCLKLFNY